MHDASIFSVEQATKEIGDDLANIVFPEYCLLLARSTSYEGLTRERLAPIKPARGLFIHVIDLVSISHLISDRDAKELHHNVSIFIMDVLRDDGVYAWRADRDG